MLRRGGRSRLFDSGAPAVPASNPAIAAELVLSHRTVQNHVQNTLRKLQLHNRVQLVRYAIEQGLDEVDEDG